MDWWALKKARESNFETITAIHVRLMVTQTRLIAVERAGSQKMGWLTLPPTHPFRFSLIKGLQTIGAVRLPSAHE